MRKQLLWSSFLLAGLALGASAQQPAPESRIVDLKNIGYPEGACRFPSVRLEFLDSARLLVSFPLHSSSCSGTGPFQTQERRAAVVDAGGKVLRTLDLQPGQFVSAGPNGRILLPTEKGLSILEDDFSAIQMLPWPKEIDTGRIPFWTWAGRNISLTPSREGFVIEGPYPSYGVAYFDGNPVKLVTATGPCFPLAGVTDGGFACFEQSPKSKVVVHLMNGDWDLEDSHLGEREWAWAALPIPDRLLLLTSKFQLYEFQRGGSLKELADLRWLAPGLWNSGSTYTITSSSAHRILLSSWGCWFPLNDTTGIGYYERVVVLDYSSGAIIFRNKYSIGSDVTISPDGHLLAIREKNRLSMVALP